MQIFRLEQWAGQIHKARLVLSCQNIWSGSNIIVGLLRQKIIENQTYNQVRNDRPTNCTFFKSICIVELTRIQKNALKSPFNSSCYPNYYLVVDRHELIQLKTWESNMQPTSQQLISHCFSYFFSEWFSKLYIIYYVE